MITGGADSLMVTGFTGARITVEHLLNREWLRAVEAWADPVYREVQGRLGYVPGAILHLYHGSRANRKYVERWRYLTDHRLDPRQDLAIDSAGLWEWTPAALRRKPEMVRLVRGCFAGRQEDA